MNKTTAAVVVGITIGMATLIWAHSRSTGANQADNAPRPATFVPSEAQGKTNAKVGILLFTDYRCEFCQKFAREQLPWLRDTYVTTGQVNLSVRTFLIDSRIDQVSYKAAIYAECARRQNRFWQMHDALFSRPVQQPGAVTAAAAASGVDEVTHADCVANRRPDEALNTDRALAEELGIVGTPTFLFGVKDSGGNYLVRDWLVGAHRREVIVDILANLGAEGLAR